MMASETAAPGGTKATLGLTGLTINAMALIAPGAFLWLTFGMQNLYGAPMAGQGMWFGIMLALALCFATAIAYAELSKLYPGAGSSYFFAEQAFLSKTKYAKFARVAKFIVGWASHLYYWVYPGVMVGVTALITGYLLGQLFPDTFNAGIPSPLFMFLFCIGFAFSVAYIAFRGVIGTTGVNMAINIIQITALLIFSFMAISYRFNHPEGSKGYTLGPDGLAVSELAVKEKVKVTEKGPDGKETEVEKEVEKKDAAGNVVMEPVIVSYKDGVAMVAPDASKPAETVATYSHHESASSVVAPHSFSYAFIQACIAILILVGFESVTSMGEEAKNAKRDIPRAVLLSLGIQGVICYAIEYFAANYALNSAYTSSQAGGSSAPIGDMMQIVGAWFFGSAKAGWWFMFVQAITVFLALIGTTLSCLSTGARVTYAMGRDEEVPSHFGMLHGKNLTPHRAIWTLAAISAVLGIATVALNFCGPAAQADEAVAALPKNLWYSFGIFHSKETAAMLPQSLLVTTLVSNFGTFLLYMLTCITAIVAFREHQSFSGFKHMFIPIFGLVANLLCMLFYIVGPFFVAGMSWKEPFVALGISAIWGAYGLYYFVTSSKAKKKAILLEGAIPSAQPAMQPATH
ncbi:MAG TPA: APC family permease [Planctomycetota bacterium]